MPSDFPALMKKGPSSMSPLVSLLDSSSHEDLQGHSSVRPSSENFSGHEDDHQGYSGIFCADDRFRRFRRRPNRQIGLLSSLYLPPVWYVRGDQWWIGQSDYDREIHSRSSGALQNKDCPHKNSSTPANTEEWKILNYTAYIRRLPEMN